jgi:hypothetical protein
MIGAGHVWPTDSVGVRGIVDQIAIEDAVGALGQTSGLLVYYTGVGLDSGAT